MEKAKELKPDVVIMQSTTPGLNGLAAAREILEHNPHQKILILSKHGSAELIRDSRKVGALGFVDLSEPAVSVIHAVIALSDNLMFFTKKDRVIAKRCQIGAVAAPARDTLQ